MKSNRAVVTLGYVQRVEVEKGVFENELIEKNVKAQFLQVFQKRINQALADGLKVTARIKVRGTINHDLDYVKYSGLKFKVNSIYQDINSHYTQIELGEQL